MGAEDYLRRAPGHEDVPRPVAHLESLHLAAWRSHFNCQNISKIRFLSRSGVHTQYLMKKLKVHINKKQRTRNDAFFANIVKNTI